MTRLPLVWLSILGLLLGFACESKKHTIPSTLTVFAAASTTEVITEAATRYSTASGVHVITNFGSSSTLAKQIKEGARADVFISADEAWMDGLVGDGLIQAGTRADLLTNALVLVAPKGKELHITMSNNFDIAKARINRLAMGDPAHVPAGRYAQESLVSLGWWETLKDKVVPAQDVRAALRLVELGEADAGVVYSTDATVSDKVEVVGEFPEDTHKPIRYPIGLCAGSSPEAARFVAFLRSPEMATVFKDRGFTPVPPR